MRCSENNLWETGASGLALQKVEVVEHENIFSTGCQEKALEVVI
jgi:hypothetical protein